MSNKPFVGQPSVGKPVSHPSSDGIHAFTHDIGPKSSGLGSTRGDGSYYNVRARDNFEGSIRGKNKMSIFAEGEKYHDVKQNTGKPIER
jgi:hypothetical protein